MYIILGEDSIQMKEKLDALNIKVTETSNKLNERLKTIEMSLPLVESFYSSFSKLTSWMDSLESSLKIFDSSSLDVQRENIKVRVKIFYILSNKFKNWFDLLIHLLKVKGLFCGFNYRLILH